MPVALLLPVLQLLRPMPGVITQSVRPGHPALDIACAPGTPVRAAHDGSGRSEQSYTHGTTFILNGPGGLQTSYSHLQSANPGGTYSRGDVIGYCGNTGAWSTGPHLHFETNQPQLLTSLSDSVPSDGKPTGPIGGSIEAVNARR